MLFVWWKAYVFWLAIACLFYDGNPFKLAFHPPIIVVAVVAYVALRLSVLQRPSRSFTLFINQANSVSCRCVVSTSEIALSIVRMAVRVYEVVCVGATLFAKRGDVC